MNIFKAAALPLAVAVLVCVTGCAKVNEDVYSEEEAVYISPSVPEEKKENYPLSLLSDEDKANYEKLLDAVHNYEDHLVLKGVSQDSARKLFKLMYTQENRIFWVDSRYYFDEDTGTYDLIYRYDRDRSSEMRAVLDMKAGEILAGIPEAASDYEKIRYLHDEIVLGCSFSKAGDYVNNAYGVLVDGAAQCEGYAFAMSYLCSSAGIENYVVTGTSVEGESHAWNKILADGQWYNVDCTWDDPILKRESPEFIRHDYFMVTDSEIINISHFPDNSHFDSLPCTATENNFFLKEGLYCTSSAEAKEMITELIKEAAAENRTEVEIRLTGMMPYTETVSMLFDGGGLKEIIEQLNGSHGAKIASAVKSVNDSLYIIHISLVYENKG